MRCEVYLAFIHLVDGVIAHEEWGAKNVEGIILRVNQELATRAVLREAGVIHIVRSADFNPMSIEKEEKRGEFVAVSVDLSVDHVPVRASDVVKQLVDKLIEEELREVNDIGPCVEDRVNAFVSHRLLKLFSLVSEAESIAWLSYGNACTELRPKEVVFHL